MVFIPMYGIILTSCDLDAGLTVVYIAQVTIAFAYIIWYDSNEDPDIMGIQKAKRHLKILLGIRDSWTIRKIIGATVSLGSLIFIVSVPTLFLCFRKEGHKGCTINGMILVLMGVVVKTIVYYKANVLAWLALKSTVTKTTQLIFG